MAWDKTKPTEGNELLNDCAAIRANFEALEDGTTAALMITNAKVSPTAAIADTKIAQIATPGKVNATAITNLAGMPAGAGSLPSANLPSVDGSKLSGLGNISSGAGTIPSANLPSDIVKTTGDQNIAGVKIFSSFSVTPSANPTANYQVANKKYVNDQDAALVAAGGFWKEVKSSKLVDSTVGALANTWYNLSTGLGASALCFFKIICNYAAGTGKFKMKHPDDTTNFTDMLSDAIGCNVADFARVNDVVYFVCPCNSSGNVQIGADSASTRITIVLWGYVK